jgi:hypothetical protein
MGEDKFEEHLRDSLSGIQDKYKGLPKWDKDKYGTYCLKVIGLYKSILGNINVTEPKVKKEAAVVEPKIKKEDDRAKGSSGFFALYKGLGTLGLIDREILLLCYLKAKCEYYRDKRSREMAYDTSPNASRDIGISRHLYNKTLFALQERGLVHLYKGCAETRDYIPYGDDRYESLKNGKTFIDFDYAKFDKLIKKGDQ